MSWSVHDGVEATKRGLAAVTVCAAPFTTMGRAQAKALGCPDLPFALVDYPFGMLKRNEIPSVAEKCVRVIAASLCEPRSASATEAEALITRAQRIEAPADPGQMNRVFYDRGWTDGLPVIAPTQESVDEMLRHTKRDRHEVVATLAPAYGAATVEYIAINAVMAGCHPEYLPLLIAATEAIADPAFNLTNVQTVTNTAAVWLIVNGPVREALQINSGVGCLGPGTWANATLGRAIRLIQHNIGGGVPGKIDHATHGQPGKYTFCCAENEEANPWEPLHVERGFAPGASTVTVVGALGTWNMNSHTQDAADLLRIIGDTMAFPASSDYVWSGAPWLILGQEHAHILHQAGLSKAEVKRRLWETSKLAASRLSAKDFAIVQNARRAELGELTSATMLPVSTRPDDINILVAGGVGTHSIYVPNTGLSRSVTREIIPGRS